MIIHASRDGVDRIFETEYGNGRVRVGQREALTAEVVIIILDCRRPVWRECPLHAGPDRPPRPSRGRAGVDGDTPDRGESIVHLFVRPGAAALNIKEPAVNETVAEPGRGRGQEVVGD